MQVRKQQLELDMEQQTVSTCLNHIIFPQMKFLVTLFKKNVYSFNSNSKILLFHIFAEGPENK